MFLRQDRTMTEVGWLVGCSKLKLLMNRRVKSRWETRSGC